MSGITVSYEDFDDRLVTGIELPGLNQTVNARVRLMPCTSNRSVPGPHVYLYPPSHEHLGYDKYPIIAMDENMIIIKLGQFGPTATPYKIL